MTVDISVVMTTRNRAQYLHEALASVCDQSLSPLLYEVIVLDNGSTDDTKAVVEEFAEATETLVRYVSEQRIGLHYARHAGAREAEGRIIVYTEDDIITPHGWLAAMCQCFEDPAVMAVAGGLDGKWEVDPPSWVARLGTNYLGLLNLGEGTFELPRSSYLCGGNFAIRKTTLVEVGGFNPDLLPVEEQHLRGDGESGLLAKLREKQYRVLYCSEATAEHIVSRKKLTPPYVINRFRREGISRAFTLCRRARGNIILMALDGIVTSARVMIYKMSAVMTRNRDRKFALRAFDTYLVSRIQHTIRLIVSFELRQYALKRNYFDE